MRIAITGGSGFIGKELVRQLYKEAERIVIVSRSESRQAEMKQEFPEYPDNKMRYCIGDIRDIDRMTTAFRGCDYVVHAAALKRVEVAEYDPREAVFTNIMGTINVASACHVAKIKKALLISTDKAVEPITLYGSTKLCAERLWTAWNNYGSCRLSACRYANVLGSTGSVLSLWKKQHEAGQAITITDKRMTRMWISVSEAARFIIDCLEKMEGGEIFVPDLKGKPILDLANEVAPGTAIKEVGLRPAEKLHETLISEADARDCWKLGNCYTIYPPFHAWREDYTKRGRRMPETFRLTSEVAKYD